VRSFDAGRDGRAYGDLLGLYDRLAASALKASTGTYDELDDGQIAALAGVVRNEGFAQDDEVRLLREPRAYQTAANANTTQSNINAAAQYADNPYLSAQIDAANRDVSRTLNEQTLPTIDRNASAAGALNSSRAGVAAGIAQRGAADQMADTAATLRGNAYSQGLTLAQQDNTNKLNALQNVIGDYSGLASSGLTALNDGATLSNNAYNTINSNNSALQADQQGQDTAAFNQWQGQDTRNQTALQNLYNIIGANNWGSTTTTTGNSTSSQSGGLLSSLLGAAAGGLGLAGDLGWTPLGTVKPTAAR
jgi:hypothetical protein